MPNFPSNIPQIQIIDPISMYGCVFDHRVVFDGATTGGTGIITSPALANFTSFDIGKRIVLTGAGAGGAQYVGTITSINSTTSANVTPNTTTTVSSKGLQIHTDDLAAWTALITDLNSTIYPGGIVQIRAPWTSSGFTGRSGISSILPTINKQIHIQGFGMAGTSDIGDYTKDGGCCIAYAGTSNTSTAFGAVLTIAPVAGASNQHIDGVALNDFWIDCRNGDQNEALKGISIQSCFGFSIENVFVMDPCAVGMEMLVISPGTPTALGEAKDCSRGMVRNYRARCLDAPAATPAVFTTTTTAVVLTATPQNFTLALALTNQPAAGYVWIQTTSGYPVLVNYTSGGGTTTLVGCTVSAQDAIGTPTTVSGSNVVQAHPGNASALVLDGDTTANANLIHFDTVVVSHGTTWGPAALDLRNSDSNEFSNTVINGGTATVINAINRVTKPGIRINGSITAISNALSSRNNVFKSGSAGAGGLSHMGVNNAGAILATQSGPTYWDEYQMGNGEPIPVAEGNTSLNWNPNGGLGGVGPPCPSPVGVATAGQAVSAATLTLINGTVLPIPPQGFQIGATLRFTIHASKTAAGIAARTFFIRIGTTGTTADAVAATITSALGTAVADNGVFIFTFTVVGPLGATCAALAEMWMTHNLAATGFCTLPNEVLVSGSGIVMATFNTTTAQQFISLSVTTGASEVLTIWQAMVEVVKPSNP